VKSKLRRGAVAKPPTLPNSQANRAVQNQVPPPFDLEKKTQLSEDLICEGWK
jgi:hypothetical protein